MSKNEKLRQMILNTLEEWRVYTDELEIELKECGKMDNDDMGNGDKFHKELEQMIKQCNNL